MHPSPWSRRDLRIADLIRSTNDGSDAMRRRLADNAAELARQRDPATAQAARDADRHELDEQYDRDWAAFADLVQLAHDFYDWTRRRGIESPQRTERHGRLRTRTRSVPIGWTLLRTTQQATPYGDGYIPEYVPQSLRQQKKAALDDKRWIGATVQLPVRLYVHGDGTLWTVDPADALTVLRDAINNGTSLRRAEQRLVHIRLERETVGFLGTPRNQDKVETAIARIAAEAGEPWP